MPSKIRNAEIRTFSPFVRCATKLYGTPVRILEEYDDGRNHPNTPSNAQRETSCPGVGRFHFGLAEVAKTGRGPCPHTLGTMHPVRPTGYRKLPRRKYFREGSQWFGAVPKAVGLRELNERREGGEIGLQRTSQPSNLSE